MMFLWCMLFTVGRVERTFFGVRFMCPFMVAVEIGNHLFTAFMVKPGTPKSWSFLIAFMSVDVGGEKKH